jgi:hypothetical protein
MDAREIEAAAERLRMGRRRTVDATVLAVTASAAAGALSLVSSIPAVALGASAAVEAIVAVVSFASRQELVARLALEPDAYVLPDVDRYGKRLVRLRERQRLATWMREVISDARLPGSFYLHERVARHAEEFDLLARELAAPGTRVQPTSAVACYRLLTRAPESPLYNGRLPADDLALALRSIRAGIHAGGAATQSRY